MRYIKAKSHGADIYLNANKIDFISEKGDTCEVFIAGSDYPLKVEDTAGEIMEKVAKVELLESAVNMFKPLNGKEIVMCKDCKYFEKYTVSPILHCKRGTQIPHSDGNGFCSYGKRKEREDGE